MTAQKESPKVKNKKLGSIALRWRYSLVVIALIILFYVIISQISHILVNDKLSQISLTSYPASYTQNLHDIPVIENDNLEIIQKEFLSQSATVSGNSSSYSSTSSTPCAWPDATLTELSGDNPNVIVSKSKCLPSTYAPSDLVDVGTAGIRKTKSSLQVRAVIVDDLTAMVSAMKKEGIGDAAVLSCYRSYATQVSTYNYWVATTGQANADLVSARPGHSEHQLGTTCDFTSSEIADRISTDFATTDAGKWLLANAPSYGFRLSYPAGQTKTTGYTYEPWHWRWVGK